MNFKIRHIDTSDHQFITELLDERWGDVKIVTRGQIHDVSTLPGFVADTGNKLIRHGGLIGLITFRICNDECEIISLDSLQENLGVGSSLIEAVTGVARDAHARRVWLTTTNDNLHAVRFYQKRGFKLVTIYRNAIQESRKLKPQIPEFGIDGIPIRDEIEMEFLFG